jgi:hypothetical protein
MKHFFSHFLLSASLMISTNLFAEGTTPAPGFGGNGPIITDPNFNPPPPQPRPWVPGLDPSIIGPTEYCRSLYIAVEEMLADVAELKANIAFLDLRLKEYDDAIKITEDDLKDIEAELLRHPNSLLLLDEKDRLTQQLNGQKATRDQIAQLKALLVNNLKEMEKAIRDHQLAYDGFECGPHLSFI